MNAPVAVQSEPAPGPSALVRYESMRTALMRCATVDEVTEIRDQAAAIAAYARLRDDSQLEVWSQEIKLRASVRIGELVQEMERSLIRGRGRHELPTGGKFKRDLIQEARLTPTEAYRLEKLAGSRDANLQAAGRAGAERYFAQARTAAVPATERGLRIAVQTAVQDAMGAQGIKQAYKAVRRTEGEADKAKRDEKVVSLADATARAARRKGHRLYELIYADPPWRFETRSQETGMNRSAEKHYPTMAIEDICALQVPAAPCCGLFLWATAPMIFEAGAVLEAWGFRYSTQIIWNKDRIGTGYRVRNKHEVLLIGVRGGFPKPDPSLVRASVIDAPVGRHSQKPAVFAEMLEAQYPRFAKLELFARTRRPGWDAWGNELNPEDLQEAAHG